MTTFDERQGALASSMPLAEARNAAKTQCCA
jgi:hypothetical protein